MYTASQHSCSLCKGPHRESFCPAARALVQKFDAATADMPSGSVCNLNRLLYLYKQHYSTAFKPIDAGFADMSRVVKALSPFVVPTVNISGTTQFVIRGKVWSTAGGADTWNLDLCTSPELVSPIASKALSSTDQFATPDTIPRETVSDHFGTDQCSTSKSLEDIFKTTIVTTGQHSRATTLGLPYRRYHTKSLSLFLHSIHDDMCQGELTLVDRFSTGCDSTLHLQCSNGNICALHGKSMRAGTVDSNPKVDSDDSAFLTLPMTVLASLAGGLTCTGLNSIMEDALGLAGISENTFTKIEGKWALAAETVLQSVLIENILQETAAAYAQNSFNETISGESCISIGVMGDACWSKISHGKTYNALAGFGVILGDLTGLPMAYGVRNSKCKACDDGVTVACDCSQQNEELFAAPAGGSEDTVCVLPLLHHNCFKNWSGSAGSMEADIVATACVSVTARGSEVMPCLQCLRNGTVIGIKKCADPGHIHTYTVPGTQDTLTHRILIDTYTADGDTSTIVAINKQYIWCTVSKIEDVNHSVKSASNTLYAKRKEDTSLGTILGSGEMRLTNSMIKKIVSYARKNIAFNSDAGHGILSVANLKTDMLKFWKHLKGDHTGCRPLRCEKSGTSVLIIPCPTVLDQTVEDVLHGLACKAAQLILNGCSNPCESIFQSHSSMSGAKHINVITGASWTCRARFTLLKKSLGSSFKSRLLDHWFPGTNLCPSLSLSPSHYQFMLLLFLFHKLSSTLKLYVLE